MVLGGVSEVDLVTCVVLIASWVGVWVENHFSKSAWMRGWILVSICAWVVTFFSCCTHVKVVGDPDSVDTDGEVDGDI